MATVPELMVAAALLAANSFFVLTEFSVTRTRPSHVEELAREGRRGATQAAHAVANIDAYLAACQLGITIASLGLGAVGESAFHDLLAPVFGDGAAIGGFALASGIGFALVTVLHVVVGELSPKSLAIARTDSMVLFVAPPMRIFYLATKPVVDLFNWMGNALLRPFGIPPAREVGHAPHSEGEIRGFIEESRSEGLLEEEEREYTERVFSFGDHAIGEVMVERAEVVTIDAGASVEEAAEAALAGGHSRLPLVGADGDVRGFLHTTDLLRAMSGPDRDLGERARGALRLDRQTPLDDALRALQREHEQLAIVTRGDEWEGLVTVEDLIEQIVGEVHDELD